MFITPQELFTMMEANNRNRLTDLLNIEEGQDVVSNGTLAEFINQANSTVESYVGQLYELPMSTVPDILKGIAGRIARYNLIAFARSEAMSEALVVDYQNAMRELQRIGSGEVKLQYPAVSRREEEVQSQILTLGRGISNNPNDTLRNVLRRL
jgi:phage gp36-like protein